MRCTNFYRGVNLLTLMLLLLSIGLNLATKISDKTSTPDTFALVSQVATPKLLPIAKKTIATTSSLPIIKTQTVSATTSNSLSIRISGRTYSIFNTSSLGTNPGSKVAFYQNQFLFAHSSGPFASLPSTSTFQIIRGGVVENYKIVQRTVYCDYSNLKYGTQYDCKNYSEPKLPARAFGNPADYYDARALGFDLILMTCAGSPLPGQDATHRLLAYAIRI